MILESEFIYSRTYYDSYDVDLMGGLSLTVSCKNLILDKWGNDKVLICKVFDLSEEEYFKLDFEGISILTHFMTQRLIFPMMSCRNFNQKT